MNNSLSTQFDIRSQADVIICRQQVREQAVALGFGLADQTRLATAVSELARNALQHGGGGVCRIAPCRKNGLEGICVSIADSGSGIGDIDQAMQDGYSTDGGLGLGLPAAKRLVHEMDIESQPGNTTITIEMYLRS